MTAGFRLGPIVTDAGLVDVLHRLALAVEPIDGATWAPAADVPVGRELPSHPVPAPGRSRRPRSGTPGRFPDPRRRPWVLPLDPVSHHRSVLRHGPTVDAHVVLRLGDGDRRWVPRRFDVALWTLAEVETCDQKPGCPRPGRFVPARSRWLRPWLLPGSAYACPAGATGARLRVVRAPGEPVRWCRVEAFGAGGVRVGWAHGDDRGEVVLLVPQPGCIPPPVPDTVDVALRVHAAPPAPAPEPRDARSDPLWDLPVEPVPRSSVPPSSSDLDNELLRGITPPAGYRTAAADVVVTLTVGDVIPLSDLTVPDL